MPVSVVVGGQFGGEGKGAVTAYLAQTGGFACLVKTGGPNAWHNYGVRGAMHDVRMVPSGATLKPTPMVFPPGSLIHVQTLFDEIEKYAVQGAVHIDPRAGIIEDEHMSVQRGDAFYASAGSSRRGTGSAGADRTRRRLRLAKDEPRLAPFMSDTGAYLASLLYNGEDVLIEGGQGFGLSNFHGDYPYVTSRDTTAACALSQVGVGSGYVSRIILVVKCMPTRNPEGNGSLAHELVVEDLEGPVQAALIEEGGTPAADGRRRRRVGMFDFEQFQRAVFANTPTGIAVTGFDRLRTTLSNTRIAAHYGSIDDFRNRIARTAMAPIVYEGWGPCLEDVKIPFGGAATGLGRARPVRQLELEAAE